MGWEETFGPNMSTAGRVVTEFGSGVISLGSKRGAGKPSEPRTVAATEMRASAAVLPTLCSSVCSCLRAENVKLYVYDYPYSKQRKEEEEEETEDNYN